MSKKFDPADHLMKVRGGAEYLEVKWRLVWLRDAQPNAVIETEMMHHDERLAVFRARVTIPDGGSATGWGSETPGDFRDYIEKAETKALGRALAALGFGTQFTGDDLNEGERIVDAPVQRQPQRANTPQPMKPEPPQVSEFGYEMPPQYRPNASQTRDVAPHGHEAPRAVSAPQRVEQAATPRQYQFIKAIARELGMSEEHLEAESSQSFGRKVDQLNRRDASIFIERLQQDRANRPTNPPPAQQAEMIPDTAAKARS